MRHPIARPYGAATLLGVLATLLIASCALLSYRLFCPSAAAPPAAPGMSSSPPGASAPSLPFEVTATIQDLMRDEIDPAADFIWDSVGSITTRTGTAEKRPQSDEDWKTLRRKAVVLTEATNLLILPGRTVTAVEFPSDGPGVLNSRDIQAEMSRTPRNFNVFAQNLRAAGRRVLAAIDAKDPTALLQEAEVMDNACEACHVAFWYPHEAIPRLPTEPPLP